MTKLKQKSLRGRCTTIPVRSSSPPQVINIDTWKRWKRFQIQNASQDHSGPDVHKAEGRGFSCLIQLSGQSQKVKDPPNTRQVPETIVLSKLRKSR